MSTAFQPNAFQSDAFQELGGLTTADVNISVGYTNLPDIASIQINVTGGFPGFEVDQAPKLWWKRKPSSPDEPAAEKTEQPKKPSKPSPEVKAQVRAAIAEAAKDQVKRGSVPKSARFAEVRSVLKPFGESADFNWPQLYERLYQQALTDALRQELELEATLLAQQQMQDDDALALLLLEM